MKINHNLIKKQINVSIKPKFKINTNQRYNKQKVGIIFTLYKYSDNIIKIGFTNEYYIGKNHIYLDDYRLIENRPGSDLEINTLKTALSELGFNPNKNNQYKYSYDLIRHMNILGWPVGSLYNYKRRKFILK